MKKTKKFISMILALAMIFSLVSFSWASEPVEQAGNKGEEVILKQITEDDEYIYYYTELPVYWVVQEGS